MQMKEKQLPKTSHGLGVGTFCFLFVALFVLTHLYVLWGTPTDPKASNKVIEIKSGLGIKQVSSLLWAQGIIRHPRLFVTFARLQGQAEHIKAGEYSLSAALAPRQVLDILVSGRAVLHKVTIPEGYTLVQIAQLLAEKKLVDPEAFIAAAHDPDLIRSLDIKASSLEGYLFPDTYYFAKGTSPKSIIKTMLAQFKKKITPQMIKRAKALGYTLHQIITLASLIEKEVKVDEERPLISAVYHNRLKANIRLQCDPTVIYALPNFDGNLTREHLKIDSPYNTYRYAGLPPGPIANPGLASILAALYPKKVNYRYFVSRNDGTHVFSATLKEHNRAVYKYQKHKR